MTIQVKPATRFLTELEPVSSEELRVLATRDGFDPKAPQGGVLFPEGEDKWILATEFERGSDGLARVTNSKALGHMRVLEGTLEELAGCATPDGRWFLPIIHSGHGSGIKNWRPPRMLAEQIANDLKKWMPHGPHKARAAAAASALRDLAPALDTISAIKSIEVRAALDRVIALSEDAEALTSSVDQLVETLLASPTIAAVIENEKAEIRRDLEALALESAERLEVEARARLTTEQAEMREALQRDKVVLDATRQEIAAGEAAIEVIRRRQRSETAAFTRSLEALIARARKEPAAYAAEWLAKLGVGELATESAGRSAFQEPESSIGIKDYEPITETELGRVLMSASPFRNEGVPRFLLMDAAIRARELVVGLGPKAREMIETWLMGFAPNWVVARVSDPSLLAFDDLLPTGPRGAAAPLAAAIARAHYAPDRAIVALLDDVDPVAGAFWLPQAARAVRCPMMHGLPPNLFMVGLIEGEASTLTLSHARVGELFSLVFDDVTPVPTGGIFAQREIPWRLYHPPLSKNGVGDRVSALRTSAQNTFTSEDAVRIGDEFSAFLHWTKHGADRPSDGMEIAITLAKAAAKTRKGEE